jgi:5-methylcytosine-specific restriction endonuclease McrA
MKRGKPLARRTWMRRTLLRAGRPRSSWWTIRRRILERDRQRCQRCAAHRAGTPLAVHHKLPRSRGGTDEDSNLTALCFACHALVHDHAAPDWSDWLVMKPHKAHA